MDNRSLFVCGLCFSFAVRAEIESGGECLVALIVRSVDVAARIVGYERVIQKLRTGKQLIDRPDRADVVLVILGTTRSRRPEPDALV